MKRLLQTIIGCVCAMSVSAQTAFTPGNLVVLQTSGTSSKASSAVTLKEFSTSGTAGKTVAIPVTGPTPFQSAGIYGGSEGFLTTSTDGKYLVVAGYATAATIPDITGSLSSTVPRAVGLVYPSGFYLQFDTSNTFFSANDIRGAISDGTNFWASGASNASIDGIDFFGPGAHTALGTGSAPPKAYGLRIFNGQIYYSSQKSGPLGSALGIFSLGTGLQTSGTATATQIITTGSTNITQDFSFNATGDVCYIAISLNAATGGIQKWTKSGSVWTLAYTLGTGVTNVGAYGLVVDYSGSVPVLYATTFEAAGNRVIKITDNGAGSAATTIVAAVANTFNKGISFAPAASGNPLVNLSVSKDTVSEAGVSVITVTANASAPVASDQTVTLGVSGTGITAGDYSLSGTTITIASGTTSGSVTFTVVDDILGEGTETANLTIAAPSSDITLGMRPTVHVTIADNDGNNHPTVSLDTSTTNFIDGGVLTAQASPFKASGVIGDPTDPVKMLGITFLAKDLETASTSLTVTATSSNVAVVPLANIVVTGADSLRNVKITPAAVGYANITVRVSDGIDVTTFVINYAASAAAATPANTVWHTGMSDASDAIAQNDNYYISGDDELNILNVYSRTKSGLPLVSYNYTAGLNLPDPTKPETDIEAAAVSPANPNKNYWLGSMSNGKSPFDNKPNRDRIFATTYTGSGAATTFTFGGYAALRTSLLAWGDANGYAFSASAAAGVDSKSVSGFAAEGMVFGPDNTTLYIGLRAPLVPTALRTNAVIAPILNFEAWFNNGTPSGNPTYGTPIELNLGGRGIRDIIKLSNGSFVIIAGNPTGDAVIGAIYKWTGNAGDAPILVNSPVAAALNMEGVMQVNTGGSLSTTSLQVITDQGDDVLYNDGTAAKDFNDLIYRKFRSDIITSLDLTYPEINIAGNGNSIADGTTALSTANNTDFGDVAYGDTVNKIFVIQNKGTATLSISGISFTGAAAGDYSVVNAPVFPLYVTANSTYSVTVQFTPSNLAFRNAAINILSNDNDEATYNFNLRGNGLCNAFTSFTVSGGGTRCSDAAGFAIDLSSSTIGVNYQLYNGATAVGSPVAGQGSQITFGLQTAAGVYSVSATHAVTGCAAGMTGSATIVVNQAPAVHTFTGGGSYCAGNAGVPIGLTLADTGISYQLYLTPGTATGSAMNGTGSALSFGSQFVMAGVYYVTATDVHSHCATTLPGVTVSVNPLPAVYNVTGGGSYCATGSGVAVTLDGSEAGISYQLYNAGNPIGNALPGTGSALDFGMQTLAGDYTIIATNATTLCLMDMASVATVTVVALPDHFSVTGGGIICASDSGAHIQLSGSESALSYQLLYNGTVAGTAVTGTGAVLDFGLQQAAGDYSVSGTNTSTGCSALMTDSVTLTVNPLPTGMYGITGGGDYCLPGAGVHIGIDNADAGYTYQLIRADTLRGAAVNGQDASLDLGLVSAGGVYKVVETNATTGCSIIMTDSVAVTPVAPVTPAVTISTGLTSGDTVCAGSPVTFTAVAVNGGDAPVYSWIIDGSAVNTMANNYTYVPANMDVVQVLLQSNAACAAPDTAGHIMIVNTVAPAVPSVTIAVTPITSISQGQADTLRAVTLNCGPSPSYQWYKNGSLIAGATNVMYTNNNFANRDSVSVRVITSGPCAGAVTYNSVLITVFAAGIGQAGYGSDMQLFPNPNTGNFTVKGMVAASNEEAAVSVTDMLGRVVYKNVIVSKNGLINEQLQLHDLLQSGVYIFEIHSGSENKVFHFVVKK